MAKFERWVTVAGITVFVVLTFSVQMLRHSSYDTGVREGWRTAVAASALLEILWVVAGIIVGAVRRRKTTVLFRIAFALNGVVVFILLQDLYRNL